MFKGNTLKECPFCGSDNVTRVLLPGLSWIVGCNDCGCRTAEYSHSVGADSSWNRRASDHSHEDRKLSEVMDSMNIPVSLDNPPF